MALQIASTLDSIPRVRRSFQSIGRELNVLVTCEVLPPKLGDKVTWFVYRGQPGPPLEVAFDASNGTFRSVSFFLQEPVRIQSTATNTLGSENLGWPVTDLRQWSTRSLDDKGAAVMDVALAGVDLLVRISDARADVEVVNAGPLKFMLGRGRVLVGFVLPELDSVTLALLARAKVLGNDSLHLMDEHDTPPPGSLKPSTITVSVEFRRT